MSVMFVLAAAAALAQPDDSGILSRHLQRAVANARECVSFAVRTMPHLESPDAPATAVTMCAEKIAEAQAINRTWLVQGMNIDPDSTEGRNLLEKELRDYRDWAVYVVREIRGMRGLPND